MSDNEMLPLVKKFLKRAIASDTTLLMTSVGIALLPLLMTFFLISLPLYYLTAFLLKVVQKYERA